MAASMTLLTIAWDLSSWERKMALFNVKKCQKPWSSMQEYMFDTEQQIGA